MSDLIWVSGPSGSRKTSTIAAVATEDGDAHPARGLRVRDLPRAGHDPALGAVPASLFAEDSLARRYGLTVVELVPAVKEPDRSARRLTVVRFGRGNLYWLLNIDGGHKPQSFRGERVLAFLDRGMNVILDSRTADPGAFIARGHTLVVAEIDASLAVCDENLRTRAKRAGKPFRASKREDIRADAIRAAGGVVRRIEYSDDATAMTDQLVTIIRERKFGWATV